MTNFGYTTGIPAGPNDPSRDQPNLQENTNSIANLIAVDHVGFGLNNGGIHNHVTMPQISTPATPPSQQLILYSKNNGLASTELRMIRDNEPLTDVALTTAGVTAPSRTQNGYSWLPGNILIQWGFSASLSFGLNTIPFPFTFKFDAGFGIIVTASPHFPSGTPRGNIYIISTSINNFVCYVSDASITNVYWHAIGPIA